MIAETRVPAIEAARRQANRAEALAERAAAEQRRNAERGAESEAQRRDRERQTAEQAAAEQATRDRQVAERAARDDAMLAERARVAEESRTRDEAARTAFLARPNCREADTLRTRTTPDQQEEALTRMVTFLNAGMVREGCSAAAEMRDGYERLRVAYARCEPAMAAPLNQQVLAPTTFMREQRCP